MISQNLHQNQRAATAKVVITSPEKNWPDTNCHCGVLVRAASDSSNLQSNPLYVPPLIPYYHELLCKARCGLLSVGDFVICWRWAPGREWTVLSFVPLLS